MGRFHASEVALRDHRFVAEKSRLLVPKGTLERFNSQFRLRSRVFGLAASSGATPEVALLLRPDMRPCSAWAFTRSSAGEWALRVRRCLWENGRMLTVPEKDAEHFVLGPNTVVVPRSRKHPGYMDDAIAAGRWGAIERFVGLHDKLRRRAYANLSAEDLIGAATAEKPPQNRQVFVEALLQRHLREVGVEVQRTAFDKGDAGLWIMGECRRLPSAEKGGGQRRRRQRSRCPVSLVEQHSTAACLEGVSYGCAKGDGKGNASSVWVLNCRGVFRCVGFDAAVRCGYPPGRGGYHCSCDGSDVESPVLRHPSSRHQLQAPAAGASRLAVCIAGISRTFTRPHVHQSIAAMLEQASAGLHSDTFAALVLEDDAPKPGQRMWAASPVSSGEQDVRATLSALRVRATDLRTASGADGVALNLRCPLDGFIGATEANARRAMAQWRTVGRCVPLIERAEDEDGTQYDYILRTRPDLFWAAAHPPLRSLLLSSTAGQSAAFWDDRPLTPFAEGFHGEKPPPQADWHFLAPRPAGLATLRLYDRYIACNGSAPPFRAPVGAVVHEHNSEVMLEASLRAHGPLLSVSLPMLLVRKSSAEPAARSLLMCSDGYAARVFGMSCAGLYERAYPGR